MNTQTLLKLLKQYPAAIGGGVLCLIFSLVLFIRWDHLAQLEFAYTEIDRESELIRQNEINAVNLTANLQRLEEYVAEIDEQLMVPDSRTDHYRYFLGLAEQSNVHIDEPALVQVVGAAGGGLETTQYGQVEYGLRASGNYPQVLEFVRQLQLGLYMNRIDRLEIQPLPAGTVQAEGPPVSVEIRVRFLTQS